MNSCAQAFAELPRKSMPRRTHFAIVACALFAGPAALASLAVSPPTLPNWTINAPGYSQTVTASGGSAPYTFAVTTGAVPAGMTLSSGGVLNGTPTTATSYTFIVTATDSLSATGTQSYTILINPAVTVAPASLPNWTISKSGYTQTITGGNGTGAKTLAVTAGAVPTGMTFTPVTGVLNGIPTATGTFNFTITATDTVGATGSQAYTVVINAAVTVAPATLPDWTANKSGYTQTITSSNGTGAKTLAVTAGAVPTGMTFTPGTGVLNGTPTVTGTFNFTITATDTVGATGLQAYTVIINPAVTVAPATLPDWTISKSGYTQTITSSNGTGAKALALTAGAVPTGMTFTPATGVLSGTPTVANTFNFTITATDTVSATGSQAYTIIINPAVTVSPATLPDWTISKSGYTQTITGSNGTGAKALALTAGAVPTGMTFTPVTGVLNGIPTATGTFNFTITATDTVGATGSQAYTVVINAAVTVAPATLPDWTANKSGYTQTITSSNGTGAKTLAVTAGAIPTGMTFIPGTGVLSGTPTAANTFNFTITATDTVGATGSQAYTVNINPAIALTPSSPLPNGAVSTPYSQTITSTGGTGTVTLVISAIANNTGLSIGGGGPATPVTVSGVATTPGTVSFTVTASDTVGATKVTNYTFNVAVSNNAYLSNLVPSSGTLSPAFVNTMLNYTTNVSNATTSISVTPTVAQVNSTVKVNGQAVVSGAPSNAITLVPGVNTVTIDVTAQDTVTKNTYLLTVNIAPAITSAASDSFTVGITRMFTVTTTGSPISAITETGALPSGLSFVDNANGTATITGTPAAGTGGSYPITIKANNTVAPADTQNFTLIVNDAPSFTNGGAANTTFTVGTAGNALVATTGFPVPTITFTGALPTGVTLTGNGTATLSGTPGIGTGGVYPIVITAANGIGTAATQNFTLTVNEAPTITSIDNVTFTAGILGNFIVTTTGYPKLTMTISETGAVATNVSFSNNFDGTARLGGAPAANTGGIYPFTITVNNGVGAPATQNFTLTVNEGAKITSPAGTTFLVGSAGTFSVTTSGNPTPAISFTGTLPTGVTLTGNGTATLSGTPAAGTGGIYPIAITASNGGSGNATQNFVLTVNQAPAITSVNSAAFTVGSFGTFTVTTTGFPFSAITQTGALPSGISLADNGDGTATLSGTAMAGTVGSFPITLKATNVSATVTQNFTITVNKAGTMTVAIVSNAPIDNADQFVTLRASVATLPALMIQGTVNQGTVAFTVMNGAAILGSPVTSSTVTGGIATATYILPGGTPLGSYTLVANYSGGSDLLGSSDASQTLNVNLPHPAITSPFSASGVVGVPFVYTIVATNLATQFTATGLPSGLTFDAATATLYGTPTAVGVTNAQITASNISGIDSETLVITVTPNQAPIITDFSTEDNPALLNVTIKYSFTATDVDTPFLSYVFNFGDGSPDLTGTFAQGTSVTLSHVYTAYGQGLPVALTVNDGFTPVSTGTLQSVPMPASGAENVSNIGQGDPPVVSPLDGLNVKIMDSDAGIIQLGIDVNSLTRGAYDVNTDWGDIAGRSSSVRGTHPVHQFSNRGIFVATTTATDHVTTLKKGKARLTIAVSSQETGDMLGITSKTPSAVQTKANVSSDIKTHALRGKFAFNGNKKDVVSYSGTISLPPGLDMSKPHEFWIAIGNIVVETTIDAHGKGMTPGTPAVLKSLRVTSKVRRNTITVGGEQAQVNATYYSSGLVQAGYDTEGISNQSTDVSGGKSAPRNIQVAFLLDGIPFQSLVPVNFNVSNNTDFGNISGRTSK